MVAVKLFNKWECEGIKVDEPGLKKYITLRPIIVPKTGAKYVGNRFHKSGINIVERLVNKVMVTGHKSKKHFITSGQHTGKKQDALKIVKSAFEIIEEKTKKNPVEVYVKASLEECIKRDVKGMYQKALAGEIKNFTGIDDPYEAPPSPELVVDTDVESVDESVEKVLRYLEKNGYLD